MKTRRDLDSLLEAVRRNAPTQRLLARSEVASMLDGAPRATPQTPTGNNRRLTMTISAFVVLAGALVVGLLDTSDDPTAPKQHTQQVTVADSVRGDDESSVDRSTEVRSSAAREDHRDDVADQVSSTRAALRGASSDASVPRHDRSERSTDRPASVLREVRATREGAAIRHRAVSDGAKPDRAKPDGTVLREIPSGGLMFRRTTLDSAETASKLGDTADQRLDIRRLGYLELTNDEAKLLGITVTKNRLEVLADDWKNAQIRESDSDDRITLFGGGNTSLKRFKLEVVPDATKFGAVDVSDDEKPLAIAPVVIVSQRRWDLRNEGSSLLFFTNAPTLAARTELVGSWDSSAVAFRNAARASTSARELNAAMSHVLGRLVPVYFRFDEGTIEGTSVRRGTDICLWYVPTAEFVAALPERYRASLEGELIAIRQVEEKNGSLDEACDRIAGKPSYLEVCRVSSGAVNAASASPNPAHGRTTVGFRLSEARRVTITLHDVNGRYMRHLSDSEERAAGEQRIDADLAGVSQGTYLVAVRTERGEQAVARLIVQ